MKALLLFLYKMGNNIFSKYNVGEKFYPIRILNNIIVSRLKSKFAEVQGHKMYLDSKDSLSLSIYKIFEPIETKIVINEVKNGYTVLDLGANIGYYTLIFAKCVGSKGKVYAFEPDPDNFKLLKKNIEINGYKNVILINKAVSDKNQIIKLYLSEDNKGDHRIYDSNDNRKYVEVESIRLDDYFKNYKGIINFVKMDIQGAEYLALKGMNKILKRYKKLRIVTEFWPSGLKKCNTEPKYYLNLLQTYGFKLFLINELKWWLKRDKNIQSADLEPTTIDKLLKNYSSEQDNATNLLCKKI